MEMENEIKRVLHKYDLGQLKGARQIERGFVNKNWTIETTHGRYFLKCRHPELRNPDLILTQRALISHLRHLGFPVPKILKGISGDTFVLLDGEFYEIQEFIEGSSYQHNRLAHLQEAAAKLGNYHACVQGFKPVALQDTGSLYNPAVLTARLTDLKNSYALKQDLLIQQIVQELESHAGDLATRFDKHGGLPYLFIHGDYHAGNLIFERNHIIGVVDYDKARWQPRVVEVAEALIYFASPRPGHLKHLVYPGFLEWEKFTRFLGYYAQGLGFDKGPVPAVNLPLLDSEARKTIATEDIILKKKEVLALPDYIRCIWLSIALQNIREKKYRSTEAAEALKEVLALSNWSVGNRQKMIKTTRKAIGRTNSS